ncbi:MAG: tRNA (adenosine(37)-N6)-threonylcarbamoyltransferase complex ATPase subunit type 1 TsaE [Candidatus Campbellbacteria bacterium]|nr:tRNA (adenosine(37)-N6)-threonylcarbamoyltransferase complex ATPase subunit type 1 TsaE [Candidatus Campbellbacteria bacterium]
MIIRSTEEMGKAAKHVLDCLSYERPKEEATILLLSGGLGAGKTTFAQALARTLGVKDRVVSPTFVIQKEYSTEHEYFHNLVHIDAYRLGSLSDLELLGWHEILKNPNTIVVLEWPERVAPIVAKESIFLQFLQIGGENEREILFEHKEKLC